MHPACIGRFIYFLHFYCQVLIKGGLKWNKLFAATCIYSSYFEEKTVCRRDWLEQVFFYLKFVIMSNVKVILII